MDHVELCIASHKIDENGYIHCPVHPFNLHNAGWVGRITEFGPKVSGVPIPSKMNVAIACTMHAKCRKARRRARFSNEQLLRWLFSAVPITAENAADEPRLAKEHVILWDSHVVSY